MPGSSLVLTYQYHPLSKSGRERKEVGRAKKSGRSTVVSHVLVSNMKMICLKMHINPKNSNCNQPLVVSSPCPDFQAFWVIFFDFCRLFLQSYLIIPRTQNHSFPSWAIEGSKVCYIKKLTFGELMKP